MDRVESVLLFFASTGTGVMAGLFFVFSNTVMPALRRIEPQAGLRAMKSINSVILNPIFLGLFLGLIALTVYFVVSYLWRGGGFLPFLASLIYLMGVVGVTTAYNVPLNHALAAISDDDQATAAFRDSYLKDWSFWNHVRSLSCIATFVLLLIHT